MKSHEDIQRAEDERQRRRVRWLERRRRFLLDAVERAGEALREANAEDFRRTMRDLFDRHPSLETVRLDQTTRYNDEFVQVEIDSAWVNGQYVRFSDGLIRGYDAGHYAPYDAGGAAPYPRLTFGSGQSDAYGDEEEHPAYQETRGDANPYEMTDEERADWRARLDAALRDALGPTYDTARAVVEALAGLRDRYGAHFYWDLFGGRAAVEVDCDAIRITEDVSDPDAYPAEESRQGVRWVNFRLGHLTEPYLTSPERGGAAGLRAAYGMELERVEGALVSARLWYAAAQIRRRERVWPLSFTGDRDGVRSVGVGERTVPVWDRRYRTGGPRLVPALGVEPDHRAAVVDVEAYAAPLRKALGDRLAGAALDWIGAIGAVLEDYGDEAFWSMPPRAFGPEPYQPPTFEF